MKVGATMAFSHHTQPAFIIDAARMIEAKGFDSLWLPEHVIFLADYDSRYPYSDNGRIPGEPDGLLDPFTAHTFIAAHTSTVRLGTGICLVPQRQPVYTARMVADLDFLSGGRVDFGVGIGWLKEEFDNLQMPFAARGKRTVEYLNVMKALWSEGVSEYHGETVDLSPCLFNPKPVQTPHPPIYFGGESDAALRRVAGHGQGWYGFNLTPEMLTERLQRLDGLLADAGRSRADIDVFVAPSTHPITPETVAAYRDLGVDQLIVPVMAGKLESLERRADNMLAITR